VAWSVVSSAAVPLDFLLYIVVSLRSEWTDANISTTKVCPVEIVCIRVTAEFPVLLHHYKFSRAL
jgi:hypothetical protein